jgi:hypothetical protein
MTVMDSAIAKVRKMAQELQEESQKIGILRSVEATTTADWLKSVAQGLTFACGEDNGFEDTQLADNERSRAQGEEIAELHDQLAQAFEALKADGHTEHCCARLVFGDGECECGRRKDG